MSRTFRGTYCPRGVPADKHEAQGLTDVIILSENKLSCVADELLDQMPPMYYLEPGKRLVQELDLKNSNIFRLAYKTVKVEDIDE